MKIVLTKLTDVIDYDEWLNKTVSSLGYTEDFSKELLTQFRERDRLGSVQIDEHVIMPHIINDQLPESLLIVSQLKKPVRYSDACDITTGIYILTYSADSSVTKVIDRLVDESVVKALQNPELSMEQLKGLLIR